MADFEYESTRDESLNASAPRASEASALPVVGKNDANEEHALEEEVFAPLQAENAAEEPITWDVEAEASEIAQLDAESHAHAEAEALATHLASEESGFGAAVASGAEEYESRGRGIDLEVEANSREMKRLRAIANNLLEEEA